MLYRALCFHANIRKHFSRFDTCLYLGIDLEHPSMVGSGFITRNFTLGTKVLCFLSNAFTVTMYSNAMVHHMNELQRSQVQIYSSAAWWRCALPHPQALPKRGHTQLVSSIPLSESSTFCSPRLHLPQSSSRYLRGCTHPLTCFRRFIYGPFPSAARKRAPRSSHVADLAEYLQ